MNSDKRLYKPSEELVGKLRHFVEVRDPVRINRNLRKVFFDYLRQQNAGLDVEFDTILDDVEAAMELLDILHLESHTYRDKSQ